MIKPEDLPLRIKNIRKRESGYAVRINRRTKGLKDAKKLIKFIEQYINCVTMYPDKSKPDEYIVHTYKEYKNLEDAIKVRDFIEARLKEYYIKNKTT